MNTEKNPDLGTRLKTAALLILVFIISAGFAIYSEIGRIIFSALVLLLLTLSSYEYSRFPENQSKLSIFSRTIFLILPALLIFCLSTSCACFEDTTKSFLAFLISIFLVQTMGIYIQAVKLRNEGVTEDLFSIFARDYIGFMLIAVGGAAALLLASLSPKMAIILVAIVSVADSSSYFSGRAYGKSKIAPLVSPKKTIIGSVIGILVGSVVGSMLLYIFAGSCFQSWATAFLVSLALVISSQTGDFAKSIAKRRFAIKDFGTIFPGHGGVLDRLDGILGAAPLGLVLLVLLCKP